MCFLYTVCLKEPYVYVSIQEGKVTIQLSLHGELDVRMDVNEVVMEVLQLFGSMGPYFECVIHVREPACGLVGHPAKCHLLRVLHKEVGSESMATCPSACRIGH